jgi:hypothetical protein
VSDLLTDSEGRLIIDVRGPRFGAAITTVVLGAALVVQGGVGTGLVVWQWFVFAVAILLQVSGLGQLIGVIGFGLLAPLTLQLGIATTVIVVTVIALVTPLAERLPHRVFEWGVRLVLLGSSLRLLYDAFLGGA